MDKLVEPARDASALHFDTDSGHPIAGPAGWVDPGNNPRLRAIHPLNGSGLPSLPVTVIEKSPFGPPAGTFAIMNAGAMS